MSNDPKAIFDHTILEREIKNIIATAVEGGQSPSMELKDSHPNLCRTFVIATSKHAGGAVRMRTFRTTYRKPFPACIWQVARATSAAPTFFAPIEIGDEVYGDGGTGWNNPAKEAIAEALDIWPKRRIGILVSIGTGLEKELELKDQPVRIPELMQLLLKNTSPGNMFKLAVAEYGVACLTSCEMVHRELADHPDQYVLHGNYFRLNVPQGMAEIGLAEWDKLPKMISLTNRYMEHGEMKQPIWNIANLLQFPQRASRTSHFSV